MPMRVTVLRRAEITNGTGHPIQIPQRKMRHLIAILALAATPVPPARLQQLLWDDDGREMGSALTTLISRLRPLIPLTKTSDGYGLDLGDEATTDLDEFRALTDEARDLIEGDLPKACRLYQRAVGLWANPLLPDLPDTAAMDVIRIGLADELRDAQAALIATRLALGHHDSELVHEIRTLLETDPLNEHLWAQLVLALYRAGRKADALAAYDDAHTTLLIETGTEPSNELLIMRDRVGRNDPALDWQPHRTWSGPRPSDRVKDGPSVARLHALMLGSKDPLAADIKAAQQVTVHSGDMREIAEDYREFRDRAITYLAEAGVRQFLDLGCGLPVGTPLHEIAQAVIPDATVVYVDWDPVVRTHRQALPAGPGTLFVEHDVRDAAGLLGLPQVKRLLNLAEPCAVICQAILQYTEDPAAVLAPYVDAIAAGSYVLISHTSLDGVTDDLLATIRQVMAQTPGPPLTPRTPAEIAALFEGLDVVDPGVVWLAEWGTGRPDREPTPLHGLGAVARKP